MAPKTPPQAATRRPPRIVRIVKFRPRLFISAAVGLAAIGVLFIVCDQWRAATKLLIGWNIGIALYLILGVRMIRHADIAHIRSRAATQDEGAMALLLLPVAAAIASLAAIFAELTAAKGGANYGWHAALAVTTITLSWTFIHALFALHYAHDYYGEGDRAKGLIFPGDDKPDYWDFVYFSFVIGMTFQVSDVQVSNRLIRRLVVTHGALSFVFNTAILALTVNLASNALGS
ncbi:MAG TPA: DUF1345 domain-containing protein [Xanthobacteraceae bacterium]|nr:DUF1345 domain-containing protein [Xanthobacteraceae bacterium]